MPKPKPPGQPDMRKHMPAFVNVDVLNSDLLLALATMPLEGLQKGRIRRRPALVLASQRDLRQ
jgi:hypothetical protein